MHDGAWIDTAREILDREGAYPTLLDAEPDPRAGWLTRLGEVFPGGPRPPLESWAAVGRRLGGSEHRVETTLSRVRALGLLAGGVADGWLPVLVVDLRSGEGWRAVLTAHPANRLRW